MMKQSVRLVLEQLEERAVPSASTFGNLQVSQYAIDGTGNNVQHTDWGSAGSDFLRTAPADYTDGISTPAGADRPSARDVSNAISDQGDDDILNNRGMSAMIYAWGQFIDHDLDLSASGTTEPLPIPVPTGDPQFDPQSTGTQTIPFTRSGFDPATGTTTPRQQVNKITARLDGSMIYGSDAATAASLRTFEGGKLKTSDGDLLPLDANGSFQAGDVRANENPELTSLHTLFVREHNRIAGEIAAANPGLDDESIYQQARGLVIAEIQVITYRQWLPDLLGPGALTPYRGYNANVNPGIANEFATAAFRMGHSLLGSDIEFLDNNGMPTADEVSLSQAFFNPDLVKTNGIDPILKYLASDPSSEVDTKVVDSVRNFLFGPPGSGGLDLASLNIQRGRDHGLADYNSIRAAYGLPRVTSFAQITSDTEVQSKLEQLYGNVDNVDAWVGMLAENHVRGGSVGPTLRAVISDQFERLRDGDRFWYQRVYSGKVRNMLEHTTLADIIRRNTGDSNLQKDVFLFKASISGTVFGDRDQDGRRDPGERGLSGRTVQLINADTSEVVATTTTNVRGQYRFEVVDGLTTGQFMVREVLPEGRRFTTPADHVIAITRGDTFIRNVNIGNAPEGQQRPPQPPPRPAQGGTHEQPPPPPSTSDSATLTTLMGQAQPPSGQPAQHAEQPPTQQGQVNHPPELPPTAPPPPGGVRPGTPPPPPPPRLGGDFNQPPQEPLS